jgi:HTTM domain
MAAVRVACGLLVLGWVVSLLPDAQAFLGADGVAPAGADLGAGWWTLTVRPDADCVLLALAAVAMTLGWRTRTSSAVVAFLMIVVQRRDIYVLDSGDELLREMCIYVALMPSGETWSLDARHRPAQLRSPWALRLLQVQISICYLFALMSKLHGDAWQNGSAVGTILQVGDLQRLVVPHVIANSVLVSALLTYGTLITEGFLILGLWHPKTRWWAMGAGAALHLGIEATILTGWFSLTIMFCYLAFFPASTLRKAVGRCLAWVPGMDAQCVAGLFQGGDAGVGREDELV